MAGVVSITFKKHIISDLPNFLAITQKKFNDLGIFNINIPPALKNEIDEIFKKDTLWVSLLRQIEEEGMDIFQRYLIDTVGSIDRWLDEWRQKESSSAGSNFSMIDTLKLNVNNLKTKFLAVMIWRKPKNLEAYQHDQKITTMRTAQNQIEVIAKRIVESSKNQSFDSLILAAKKDYFRTKCWPQGKSEMISNEFFELFKDDFFLFIKKINQIYLKEIKKKLNITQVVRVGDLEKIYSYFFGSYQNFVKFLNRNYQYDLIEEGLEEQGIDYENLQNSINNTIADRELKIAHCPFPQLRNKSFNINTSGLPGSPRFCEDKLIIFGKDSTDEFTTDIVIPNIAGIDSIFAFIYTNVYGYHLVDISKRASVRIKITPRVGFELKHNMIIILAKVHAYLIELSQELMLNGRNVRTLKIKPAPKATATANCREVNLSPGDKAFKIGRGEINDLKMDHADISHEHCEIYLDQEDSKWKIQDLNSTNGTYFKLKNYDQMVNMKPSDSICINEKIVFCVENFNFLFRPLS